MMAVHGASPMEVEPVGDAVDGLTMGQMIAQIRAIIDRGEDSLALIALQQLVDEVQKRRSERTLMTTPTPPGSGASGAGLDATSPPTFGMSTVPPPTSISPTFASPGNQRQLRESCLATMPCVPTCNGLPR